MLPCNFFGIGFLLIQVAKERLKQVFTHAGEKDLPELSSNPPQIEIDNQLQFLDEVQIIVEESHLFYLNAVKKDGPIDNWKKLLGLKRVGDDVHMNHKIIVDQFECDYEDEEMLSIDSLD
ncbi:hypothetical protein Fot_31863 [Forsythia ovata]|uniref:Uncharacterized protein n=1 Tax=Forsythia ovata TaxID=205694 RepID=A0ABD1T653_9LAMI